MTRTLTLKNRYQGNTTTVENEFIDFYMAKANGEYVKVYLMLLRYLNADDHSMSISKMADYLECTEKDVLRALNYWHEVGLLRIDYDESGNICGLSIGKAISRASEPEVIEKASPVVSKAVPDTAVVSQEDLRQLFLRRASFLVRFN